MCGIDAGKGRVLLQRIYILGEKNTQKLEEISHFTLYHVLLLWFLSTLYI